MGWRSLAQGEVGARGAGLEILTADLSPVEITMRPEGLEPPRVAPQDPKSCASTNSATVAGRSIVMKNQEAATRVEVDITQDHRFRLAALQFVTLVILH